MKALLAIGTLSVVLIAAQAVRSQDDQKPPPVSSAALSRIVEIVLREEFKPADELKFVYLSKRFIQQSRLPEIRNVVFILIHSAEFEKNNKVHFFKEFVLKDGELRVDFGFGDSCSASGKSWFFRVSGDDVQDANKGRGGGWGTACVRAAQTANRYFN